MIQTAAETPSAVATRAMTEQEAQRVMEALNTPERSSISGTDICGPLKMQCYPENLVIISEEAIKARLGH